MQRRVGAGLSRPCAARCRAFSLVELLVVLFVIVLMTSLATLNVGDGGQQQVLESQVRELRNVAEFALEEAQMAGRDMGLVLAVDARGAQTQYLYDWREQIGRASCRERV